MGGHAGVATTPSDAGDAGQGGEGGAGGDASTPSCTTDQYNDGTACQPLTVCGAGEYQKTAPTPDSDRVCSPCASGKFSSSVNAESCTSWSVCKTGETESVAPSATSDRVCSTCGTGKYSANGQCQSLTVCTAQQYESTPATATSDRKCSAVTSCQPGSAQTAAPTTASDRQCAACASGSFSTQVNALACKAWTPCTASQNQTMAGTATSDIVCVDKPVCSTAPDRTCTTQCPCASSEGVCTASNQCASGSSCVAGSGIKVGRTGNTCLADHCNNDKQDSGETSVDCGGECGCRATFTIVSYKNVPTGAAIVTSPVAMSRDGTRLVGYIGRNQSSYPATFAVDGTVTELESYGKGGTAYAVTSDGSVVVGGSGCTNPPTCSTTGNVRWAGTSAPTPLSVSGTLRATSSSGTMYAGDGSEDGTAFLFNGSSRTLIPDLLSCAGLTPDGKYVAGTYKDGKQGALWYAQTQAVKLIGDPNWTNTNVKGLNGTDPAVIGYGYISSSDSYIGFRWKGGSITQLGLLPGGVYTIPNAVSLDGSTVVGLTGSNAFQQAFIWTDSGKLRTIVDELKSRGLEPPVDLALNSADFVSDDGKTIVGWLAGSPPTFWRAVLQ